MARTHSLPYHEWWHFEGQWGSNEDSHLLLAEHEAQFPQPAHLSSHHSRGHCTQTHCFLQKIKLFPIPFLCLAHPLLFPGSRGTSTGKPDHQQRHVPHGSLTCWSQYPLTLLRMYLLNDYGFKSILPTILYVWGSYLFSLPLYLSSHGRAIHIC